MEKKLSAAQKYLEIYETFRLKGLYGRYLIYDYIKDFLESISENLKVDYSGESTLGIPIPYLKTGNGPTRILVWSQMHGNETTTTKAILDVLNGINGKVAIFEEVLENCTICIIPMLNPDGAKMYTRENANYVDLNRDAQDLSQVESLFLRRIFEDFKPDFCFNLHDQRTIFSAGKKPSPATLSFLTPAIDQERSLAEDRVKSMKVIATIAKDLELEIPGFIGRYDDAFNLNCTGDTFQSMGVPTILFEAGHFPEDYERVRTRKLAGAAIFSAMKAIATKNYLETEQSEYFKIPENQKLYVDILLKNASVKDQIVNIGIQYKEVLEENEVRLLPIIQCLLRESNLFGHKEIDCEGKAVVLENNAEIDENVIVKEIYINNEVLAIN